MVAMVDGVAFLQLVFKDKKRCCRFVMVEHRDQGVVVVDDGDDLYTDNQSINENLWFPNQMSGNGGQVFQTQSVLYQIAATAAAATHPVYTDWNKIEPGNEFTLYLS